MTEANVRRSRPSAWVSTLVVAALTGGWGYARLILFPDAVFPLTFVLPLLVCLWTRRSWQLWSMAGAFAVFAAVKSFVLLPSHGVPAHEAELYFVGIMVNVIVGAAIVQFVLRQQTLTAEQSARIAAINSQLEAQSEELQQQNEEIKTKAEELAQQSEEIEAQAEEMERQNEELQDANVRLGTREEILQGLLQATRYPEHGQRALQEVCGRAVRILGAPAEALAYLERDGDSLNLRAHASANQSMEFPLVWSIADSLIRIVLEEDKTAYVHDLAQRPDVAGPLKPEHGIRSIIATPVRVAGAATGVLVGFSVQPAHWTQDQFRMIEWVAAQCGLIGEGLRWQRVLTDRAREIETANRAKDQFLAMLSHELRTPLTPVLAAAGALEEDPRLPEDVRDDIRMIRRNVGIQSRLIDDLLDLTRVSQGKLDLVHETLAVPALIMQTAEVVAADIDAKDQVLVLALDQSQGCTVSGDGPRLQQVFWNLLKNASKFSPPKARISVTARVIPEPPARVAIEIVDSGVGIDAEDLTRIFRPFEQAGSPVRRTTGGGLGLGLAIAKAVVELHHGAIHAYSEGVDKGAKFTVELPLNAAPPPTHDSVPPFVRELHRSVTPFRALRILLVEDHIDTGRIIGRLLRNSGHAVEHAENAQTALATFRQKEFELVISDLGLPDQSGLQLMRQIRAIRPDIPGICLSGYGMEDDLRACYDAGFDEHITKPVDIQRLRAVVARLGNIKG